MHKQYFVSDCHFGHANILTFKDKNGELIRPFSSLEEMHNTIIDHINDVVRIQDKIYILGDIAMSRKWLYILDRINTKKRILIRGNHDICKLKEYLPYFKDIRACKVMPKHGIIFTHIPVHPSCLEGRIKRNIHGHTHSNSIIDGRYLNICPEVVGYKPLEMEEILEKLKDG